MFLLLLWSSVSPPPFFVPAVRDQSLSCGSLWDQMMDRPPNVLCPAHREDDQGRGTMDSNSNPWVGEGGGGCNLVCTGQQKAKVCLKDVW